MGQVWVARHLHLDSLVAVKLLAPSAVSNEVLRARFEREARALGQLRSPHVVQVFDYGVEEIGPFMVMELLEGDDLAFLRTQRRYWSLTEVAQIVMQAARGLNAAHKAGVIHRDIKPGNLFLARIEDETVLKVLDFGIAKPLEDNVTEITKTNVGVGSPSYMSPEQTQALPVDARTDNWSLAVVAFALLTGELPFQAESPFMIGQKVLRGQRPRATQLVEGLPRALDAFFDRALAVSKDDRFATPLELADALAAIARLYPDATAIDPDVVTTERLSRVHEARKAVALKGLVSNGLTIKLTADDLQPALARAGYALPVPPRPAPPRPPPPSDENTGETVVQSRESLAEIEQRAVAPPAPSSRRGPPSRPPLAPPRASRPPLPTPRPSTPARSSPGTVPPPPSAAPVSPPRAVAEPTPDASDFAPTTRLSDGSVKMAIEARNQRLAQSGAHFESPLAPQRVPALSQSYGDAAFGDVSSGMIANPYRRDGFGMETAAAFANPVRRARKNRLLVIASIVGGTIVNIALVAGAWWLSSDTSSPAATSSARSSQPIMTSSAASATQSATAPTPPTSSVSASSSATPSASIKTPPKR
ncbi:MAG: serine/threonine protein kinase [Polyangiaceae bacterium]|nr:serine/threonine protein kinase [Polyangiaceae bacterium]